jgi:hypothetical protein
MGYTAEVIGTEKEYVIVLLQVVGAAPTALKGMVKFLSSDKFVMVGNNIAGDFTRMGSAYCSTRTHRNSGAGSGGKQWICDRHTETSEDALQGNQRARQFGCASRTRYRVPSQQCRGSARLRLDCTVSL